MKITTSTIVIIHIVVLLSFSRSADGGFPVQQPTPPNALEDIQTFFPLLEDEALDISYLLSELNIVGDQQEKLKKVGEQGLKKWLAIMAEGMKQANVQGGMTNSPQVRNEMLAFQKSFVKQIDDVLLPHQMKAMRCLLKQRSLLQRFDYQGFELISGGTVEFELSEQVDRDFKTTSKQLSEDFNKRKRELAQQAWERIKPGMPDQSTKGLSELLSLVGAEQKSRLRGERVEFRELKKWTEDDYGNYEKRKYQDLVYSLMRSQPLRDQLNVLEFQVDLMIKINVRKRDEVSENGNSDYRQKATALAEAGDVEGMKALFKEKKNAELVARQKVIDEISKEVLLPAQIDLIKSVAKFQRLSREAKYGDEFGAAIAWSKSFVGPEFDSAKLIKLVNSARDEYYTELKKLRKSTWDKTLNALPKQAQLKFQSTYGEFYDFQSERVASWDKFRNASK
jgi:hypothetical protein